MDLEHALSAAPVSQPRARKGPAPECEIYGNGTLQDFRAVDARRRATSWAEAQRTLDGILGIEKPVKQDNFRYHWRGRCSHFDAIRDELDRS